MGLFDLAESRIAALEARVAALEGGTITPPVDPPAEPPSDPEPAPPIQMLTGTQTLVSGQTLRDCIIRAGSSNGMAGTGTKGAGIFNVAVESSYDCLKLGSGAETAGLRAAWLRGAGSHVGMFLANVSDAEFQHLVLSGGYALYLERGNHGLVFRDVDLTSSAQWCVHAYCYETQSQPSDSLLIEGGRLIAAYGGVVISAGWSDVILRGLEIRAGASYPALRMYGAAKDVLVEDCEIWGGYALIEATKTPAPSNVRLRNVIYHGAALPTYPWLTLDNVRLEK